ncbi:bifunctional Cwf19-like protein/Cwf19-like protein [Babesia duncani]|uniref:Bifunctional Cwf19-like protein/Cwf19-like protein n=1 Tax=Babesia duncani TaxID=323732 RepID=A0AAD9UPC8_9APIC|nr:bifunctional Cwf19-like protein/Cwf19-like protein [Babesia duncani]
MAPEREAILVDELCLVPTRHVLRINELNDDEYTELRNYQKTLVQMFYNMQKALLFVETSLVKSSEHAMIYCFAIPEEMLDDAKMHFKATMQDQLSDWSENFKIIKITGKQGTRGFIPRDFSFMHVDYNLQEGVACVLDDNRNLRNLARQVVAGILKIDPFQRAFRNATEYQAALARLLREYSKYDWTTM